MKEYKVEVVTKGLFTSKLPAAVARKLSDETAMGWEIVTVSFGLSLWWIPTAFITFQKNA